MSDQSSELMGQFLSTPGTASASRANEAVSRSESVPATWGTTVRVMFLRAEAGRDALLIVEEGIEAESGVAAGDLARRPASAAISQSL
jgi:hypothetical protein